MNCDHLTPVTAGETLQRLAACEDLGEARFVLAATIIAWLEDSTGWPPQEFAPFLHACTQYAGPVRIEGSGQTVATDVELSELVMRANAQLTGS